MSSYLSFHLQIITAFSIKYYIDGELYDTSGIGSSEKNIQVEPGRHKVQLKASIFPSTIESEPLSILVSDGKTIHINVKQTIFPPSLRLERDED